MLEIFERKPYIAVPIPDRLRQLTEESHHLWRDFCSLSDKFKGKLQFLKFDTDWADPGYRNKKANPGDKKEYYHYTLGNEHFMFVDGVMRAVDFEPKALKFFGVAHEILLSAG